MTRKRRNRAMADKFDLDAAMRLYAQKSKDELFLLEVLSDVEALREKIKKRADKPPGDIQAGGTGDV